MATRDSNACARGAEADGLAPLRHRRVKARERTRLAIVDDPMELVFTREDAGYALARDVVFLLGDAGEAPDHEAWAAIVETAAKKAKRARQKFGGVR